MLTLRCYTIEPLNSQAAGMLTHRRWIDEITSSKDRNRQCHADSSYAYNTPKSCPQPGRRNCGLDAHYICVQVCDR